MGFRGQYAVRTALWFLLAALFVASDLRAGEELQGKGDIALVYNGPASAEDCPEAVAVIAERAGLKVRFVSNVGELPRLLPGVAVFIIGGTVDDLHPLLREFTPVVTEALKGYLREGGRFYGICGGGFIVSTGWSEEGALVKALGIIPAATKVYRESAAAQIVPVRWRGTARPMYVKAGPSFQLTPNAAAPVEVVATYDDGSIAGLISAYGKGKLAVCGPHPEARASWIEEAKNPETWVSSTELAVELLKDVLSSRSIIPKGGERIFERQ